MQRIKTSILTGPTVPWTRADSMALAATANDGSFDTGVFAPGATASLFKTVGIFPYYCTIHGQIGMNGTLEIAAS